jgi:hypothetical protein
MIVGDAETAQHGWSWAFRMLWKVRLARSIAAPSAEPHRAPLPTLRTTLDCDARRFARAQEGAPRCPLKIADTILFNDGHPVRWLFTSKVRAHVRPRPQRPRHIAAKTFAAARAGSGVRPRRRGL